MVNTEAYALEKLTNDIIETHPITYKTISHNVWALCCSGDHDLCIPFPGTEAWVRSIGYQVVDRWRPWYFGDQVAGYAEGYDHNLTFLTIKGAGHAVPEYKPKESLAFYSRWLAGEKF
uniref:Uncharacterized protein n=1 Tax=Setaria italica TaxID=4555 RepID=K3YF35_SETIT